VTPGDSFVILLPNCTAWPIAVAAGMRTGLQVTPVNWHLRSTELIPLLTDADPAAVITNRDLAPLVQQALAERADPPLVLIVGEPGGTSPADDADHASTAATVLDLDAALAPQPVTPVPDELLGARTLYSGGTTGRPKAHRQPLLGIHPLDAPARHPGLAEKLGIRPGIRLLSPAPNYHAAPFTFQLMTLAVGGTVVCMESFDAAAALRALHEHRITHSQWVPTMLSRMLDLPDHDAYPPAPDHRTAVTSGAPCPVGLKEAINDWWGDILHEYYGASEGYGHTYISPEESRVRRGSVGRPLGSATVRILDEFGAPLPAEAAGRVVFEATQSDGSVTRKGMGDLGRLDADGYLYLDGRASFMIISGGVNIHPEEIESALASHASVSDAAVFGLPHPDLGEQVVAIIEPKAGLTGSDTLAEELREHCRTLLARFKAPRRIEFVESLPRLPTGKLNKKSLREEYVQS
jgi:fatty-acyl-CoA synthase